MSIRFTCPNGHELNVKDKYAGLNLGDKEWIKAMIEHPILMQRPIVVRGEAAVIGRPPEDVKPLLKSSSA